MWIILLWNFLKAVWPYIQETLFGHRSARAWFVKNFFTLMWFLLILVMMTVVLRLYEQLRLEDMDLGKLREEVVLERCATKPTPTPPIPVKITVPVLKPPIALHVPLPLPEPKHPAKNNNRKLKRELRDLSREEGGP